MSLLSHFPYRNTVLPYIPWCIGRRIQYLQPPHGKIHHVDKGWGDTGRFLN